MHNLQYLQSQLTSTLETKGQFAGGKVDPVEAGRKGGQVGGTASGGDSASAQQGSDYKPTENDGLRKGMSLPSFYSHYRADVCSDGQPDGRVKGN